MRPGTLTAIFLIGAIIAMDEAITALQRTETAAARFTGQLIGRATVIVGID